MKKNFTFVLPDEPYKTTTDLNQTVNAVYEGPRYNLARIENATKIVQNIVRRGDTIESLEVANYIEEGHTFVVLDAMDNAREIAFLTGDYTHELIEDPVFELPNGLPSWTYHYDDYTGGMNQCFYINSLKYDVATKQFSGPEYREHAVTRESLFEGNRIYAAEIRKCLAENDYPAEDAQTLADYATWLEGLEEMYEGIDHWKIRFPTNIPNL